MHRILRRGGWLIASYMSDERYILDLRVDFRMIYNAEALVHHLTVAARFEERQRQRLAEGKPLPEDFEPPPEA